MRKLLYIAILSAIFTACQRPADQWAEIPKEGWVYGNMLTFSTDTANVPAPELLLTVKHDDAYPYANLWLEASYTTDTDTTAVCDTFDVRLADVYGKWYGSGSALSIQRVDTLHLSKTPKAGEPLKVRHIMRVDTLRYVEQIGIKYLR